MTDEETKTEEQQEQPQEQPQEPQEPEKDWKAEAELWKKRSREWESRSKENKKVADAMEDAAARAEAAEAELEQVKAEAVRTEACLRISKERDVPYELLDFCKDGEAMEAFADAYEKAHGSVRAVASADGSRVLRTLEKRQDKGEVFADFARNLIKE